MPKNKVLSFSILLILLLILVLLVQNIDRVTSLFGLARGQNANLVISLSSSYQGDIDVWQHLAQGGEEMGKRMLAPVINETAALKPQYIRLDHIYDHYSVVHRQNGQLVFNWHELDLAVDDILAANATPFFSLSYMPNAISSGTETDLPANWSEWEFVVQSTIEHFSRDRALQNVYYEIWNEPDLFGNFKTYGDKNYLDLYYHSALGASRAQGTRPFKLGGPATTALYQNWITNLLEFCHENNLKIDFVSWHTYSTDLGKFESDLSSLLQWLLQFPQYQAVELIISELGPDSANNPVYDNSFGSIHALAMTAFLQNKVDRAFTFEIKDGPGTEKYWGRWGLFTHEKFGAPEKKPRAHALNYLNQLAGGRRLNLAGEGSWVKAFAKKFDNTVKLFVVNYDPNAKHVESVPIKFINLPSQSFTYQRVNYTGESTQPLNITTESSSWETIEYFAPNTAAIITLTSTQP